MEPEVFYKVQEMMKYNQRAAAHKNAKGRLSTDGKIVLRQMRANDGGCQRHQPYRDKASLLLLHGTAEEEMQQKACTQDLDRGPCVGVCSGLDPK